MKPTYVYIFFVSVAAATARAADFPDAPDFKRERDYVSWYRNELPDVSDSNNAYSAYEKFMPNLESGSVSEGDWPKFRGMLSMSDHERAQTGLSASTADGTWPPGPGPWRSEFHPYWAKSYDSTKGVLAKFRDAAKRKSLVAPVDLGGDGKSGRLVSLRFPYLQYQRECAAGLIEGAWQVTDDAVSTKRLRSAIGSNLNTAHQMRGSLSADEQSAAMTLRSQTYDTIRWAFAHGVFNEQNAADVAKLLRRVDRDRIDPSSAAAGECAKWLDGLQYIFTPFSGGKGQFNGNKYREITGQSMGGGNRLGIGARLETDPEGSGSAILDGYRAIGNILEEGFTGERVQELNAAFERMRNATNVNKGMFLSGSYAMTGLYRAAGRAEVHRRGVQLVAELYAYKGRKGAWPKTLNDLGDKASSGLENDGGCGKSFMYVVQGDEMFLYSVGPDCEDDGGLANAAGDGDEVIWPIPDSDEWIAACRLTMLPAKELTKLSDINKALVGKTVVVAADVQGVSSEVSKEHGRVLRANLEGDGNAQLVYYQSVAEGLTPHQTVDTGVKLRVRVKVVEIDGAIKLLLENARDLAHAW